MRVLVIKNALVIMDGSLGGLLFILICIGLGIFLFWFIVFKCKHLKTPDVFLVDGGVKVGKSLVTVKLAVTQYRKNLIRYYVGNALIRFFNLFRKLFKKEPRKLIEKPMLYSNMPLYKVKYNPFTTDILLGNVRIPHRSVCLLDEATLLADSMTGYIGGKQSRKDKENFDFVNEKLTLFLKTYGHMTHGGSVFYNSQQVCDLHFSFKRCTASYLMVFKNRKFPFFCLINCRELVHDESGDVRNNFERDVDDDNKPLFISKRWYKYYDRYYLDVLTKNLPLYVDYHVRKVSPYERQELKEIVTLGNYQTIREYNERMARS